jgi:hypothetical protein
MAAGTRRIHGKALLPFPMTSGARLRKSSERKAFSAMADLPF